MVPLSAEGAFLLSRDGQVCVLLSTDKSLWKVETTMLLNLWMTVQFIVVLLSADVDSVIPQSPTHLIVLVLLGAALLSPAAGWAATALVRVLSLAPHGPWMGRERTEIRDFRTPEEPGTPGTALARAPTVVVHPCA